MSLEMTRGPLAFRGGAGGGGGGGGGANNFWKKAERRGGGERAADLLRPSAREAGLTSGTGLASFSLARASFLGSLLFTTNRAGPLEDTTNATDVTPPRKRKSCSFTVASRNLRLSSETQTERWLSPAPHSRLFYIHTAIGCFYRISLLLLPLSPVTEDQVIKKVFSRTAVELIWT